MHESNGNEAKKIEKEILKIISDKYTNKKMPTKIKHESNQLLACTLFLGAQKARENLR
jgi:hypothetical protein